MAGYDKANLMDGSATGTVFTDLDVTDFGSAASSLTAKEENEAHDWFWGGTSLVVRTASGGGGTLLTEDTDYTLSVTNTSLGSFSGKTTYNKVQIINATYQTGALYFSGYWVGDSIEADDINDLRHNVLAKSADYTIADKEKDIHILMTTGGSNQTITLPAAANNLSKIHVYKVDSGAGHLVIHTAGADTITNMDNTGYTTVESWWQGNGYEFISDGTATWYNIKHGVYIIPESSRPNTLNPNAGSSQTFVDADYSSSIPVGVYGMEMMAFLTVNGDGVTDYVDVLIRKNGDSETNATRLRIMRWQYNNLASTETVLENTYLSVKVDNDRIFEYKLEPNSGSAGIAFSMNPRSIFV